MIHVWALKSDRLASRVIRFGLGEDASHLAIGFMDKIWHSSVNGVEVLKPTAILNYQISSYVILPADEYQERRICYELTSHDPSGYDWRAFVYFSWRALLKVSLGIPIPDRGPEDEDRFLCVEALYTFLEVYSQVTGRTIELPGRMLSVMSPIECLEWLGRSFNLPVIRS